MAKSSMTLLVSALAIFGASPSFAEPVITATALKFSNIEANAPRDPLTRDSSAGHWTATERGDLTGAEALINRAIPVGTNATLAKVALQKAGAHCAAVENGRIVCRYFDAETIDEYVDDVRWKTVINLDGTAVRDIHLDRAYARH